MRPSKHMVCVLQHELDKAKVGRKAEVHKPWRFCSPAAHAPCLTAQLRAAFSVDTQSSQTPSLCQAVLASPLANETSSVKSRSQGSAAPLTIHQARSGNVHHNQLDTRAVVSKPGNWALGGEKVSSTTTGAGNVGHVAKQASHAADVGAGRILVPHELMHTAVSSSGLEGAAGIDTADSTPQIQHLTRLEADVVLAAVDEDTGRGQHLFYLPLTATFASGLQSSDGSM
jgi:hypothetical protein